MALNISDLLTKHKEAILYIICGGFTTLISWGSYAAFVWVDIAPAISNILSWVASVAFAFVVNKWIVFESKTLEKKAVAEEAGFFFGARIITMIVAAVLFYLMYNIAGLEFGVTLFTCSIFGAEGMITRVITSVVEIALNWGFSKYVVFRKGSIHNQ